MIDAVLSAHADPMTCGVTNFSQQLARRLWVPWSTMDRPVGNAPLLSVKFSETQHDWRHPFDLFLHEPEDTARLRAAGRVFAASSDIATCVRSIRPDVIAAWCPSLVTTRPRAPLTVLSCGMAHKLQTAHYARLKAKLDATCEPYVVYVSAALHDGTTFGEASAAFEDLRALFGDHFVFLGTLSEEAMVDRLRTCSYVAAFFPNGLRENNTSVMAALEAGASVITNCDRWTPADLRNMVWDIGTPDNLPCVRQRNEMRARYGWEPLLELIRA